MGGHGALTIALKNPGRYWSVSAFSPIVSPMRCPWGRKVFGGYLGADEALWVNYDACALMQAGGAQFDDILIDQGDADSFLDEQLKAHLFLEAYGEVGQKHTSYYFIASFIENHLRFHADRLTR